VFLFVFEKHGCFTLKPIRFHHYTLTNLSYYCHQLLKIAIGFGLDVCVIRFFHTIIYLIKRLRWVYHRWFRTHV